MRTRREREHARNILSGYSDACAAPTPTQRRSNRVKERERSFLNESDSCGFVELLLPTSLSVCVLCISLWRCLHTHLVPIRTAAASADVAASPASASAPASAARLGTRWYLELEQRSAHSTRRRRQPVSNNNNNSNMFVIASNNNISCCCCLRRCHCAATAAIGPGRQIMQSQRQEMFSASAAAAAAIDRAAIA